MVGGVWIEDLREALGRDAVELKPQRPAARKCCRSCQAPRLRCAEILQEPDRGPGVGTDLIHPRLLAIELLNYDERKHYVVFIESERGMRVGQENAGVEYVVRGRQGASLSRRMCCGKRRRERSEKQAPGTPAPPCRTLWPAEEEL